MCLFHKWGKWEQYEKKVTFLAGVLYPKKVQGQIFSRTDQRQKQFCSECNKVKDILVRTGDDKG